MKLLISKRQSFTGKQKSKALSNVKCRSSIENTGGVVKLKKRKGTNRPNYKPKSMFWFGRAWRNLGCASGELNLCSYDVLLSWPPHILTLPLTRLTHEPANTHWPSPRELLVFFEKPSGISSSHQFGRQHVNAAILASYPGAVQRKRICKNSFLIDTMECNGYSILFSSPAGLCHAEPGGHKG